jgi:5-methylcytosine-specific restriction endonuclease McrA
MDEERECIRHGLTLFAKERRRRPERDNEWHYAYRCKQCRTENVTRQRVTLRKQLVEKAGGCCVECGYDKSIWSLHFDHIDPSTKVAAVSVLIRDGKRKKAREEVEKCQLLCANCHGEITEKRFLERL